MLGWAGRLAGRAVLLEAGAAIIFFGSLMHQPKLVEYAARALQELRLRGYEIPTAADPVRAYPAATSEHFSSFHAGGWRPGVMVLRMHPEGGTKVEMVLRHELMHEASLRTCRGKLPLWAEEAAAMSFSGELSGAQGAEMPTDADLANLRRRVRVGARLDPDSWRTLSSLVACYGWPTKPCARSETIEKLVSQPPAPSETGFSYVLVSLISGRLLEARGDLETCYPPGSLLKVPYAAALREAPPAEVSRELAASDTEQLLSRRANLEWERLRFLLSPAGESALSASIRPEEGGGEDERFWRQCLGERAVDGGFPLEANLLDLARILRASLRYRPEYFAGLSQNGLLAASTLYRAPAEDKRILTKLQALAKTGTVADERGTPLLGHLMVAWPAKEPVFLAVFRSLGVNGAANLHRAGKMLRAWAARYPPRFGKVRVRLLAPVPRASWEVLDECPTFERVEAGGWKERVSTCGRFRIISTVRGSRPERLITGVLLSSPDDRTVVLETDPESYADAVLAAEAQELRGEGARALRSVILWNGVHGRHRHEDTSSLCDTTHCMVFQGSLPDAEEARGIQSDPALLKLLDQLAASRKRDWLPFSKGGSEPWVRAVSVPGLRHAVGEPSILDIRRQRTRTGSIVIHLMYGETEETVPCEVFRNRLKLPSCPEVVRYDEGHDLWHFSGIGKGHGEGLSIARAAALAEAGHSAAAILTDAYR